MAIITISQELAALGEETTRELTRLMGYRLVGKKSLEENMRAGGLSESKLKKYDERRPSFIASLSQDRDDYLHYLKTAILSEAESGNCVFTGRGANAVLGSVPAVFSVLLTASMDIRTERVKSYFHCDDKRARQIIEHSDQDRGGFYRSFFDMDWRDPDNYSISLNTGISSPMVCAKMVRQLIEQTVTPETEAMHTNCLKDLILGQRIKHHILYTKEIPVHFLEVIVSSGSVTMYGAAQSQVLVETALHAAREISGAAQVVCEIRVVQDYSIIA